MNIQHPRIEHNISRRDFLKFSTASALGALVPISVNAADTRLNQRVIPSSGEHIPVIGLGTARTFDVDPNDETTMAPLRQVLSHFFEGGGRLVDSSPMYGQAETVVGRLAADLGIAETLFMVTKVWTEGREAGIEQMLRSQKRMGGGPLELIQVHNLVDTETHLDTLKAWKQEGRIRYLGVTHYRSSEHDRLARWCEREPLDFIQFNYNIQDRNAERRLLPAAMDNGVATLINVPFQRGRLFAPVRGKTLPTWTDELDIKSWAQFFLKFIVSHPAVTCAIPATRKPAHSADNIGAAHGLLPDGQQRQRMVHYFEGL